jgi:hypothetical protein
VIHPNQWLLISLDREGHSFWEKSIADKKQANELFEDMCRHAVIHGGRYKLRAPDGTHVSFSAAAESE